ncbi:MAG: hypothetical protein IKD69_05890 [Solobacterium sp.]|nr:hypothetical protein [Solobacterium sp.]
MKALRENSLLFAALTAFTIVSGSRFPLTVFVISLLVWHHRVHASRPLFALLLFLMLVRIHLPEINAEKGIVTEVKSSYAVISDGLNRTMLKGEREVEYGDVVRVTGEYEPVTSVPGFFAFDFAAYCRHKRIYASAGEYAVEGHAFSLRYFIERRIRQLPESLQPLLYKVLLQRTADKDQTGWLFEHGLSLTAMASFLEAVLGFFLREKARRRISLTVLVLLGIIYHFPVSITLSILLRCFPKAERKQKNGCVLAAILFLYPYAVCSLSFLMPAVILTCRIRMLSPWPTLMKVTSPNGWKSPRARKTVREMFKSISWYFPCGSRLTVRAYRINPTPRTEPLSPNASMPSSSASPFLSICPTSGKGKASSSQHTSVTRPLYRRTSGYRMLVITAI